MKNLIITILALLVLSSCYLAEELPPDQSTWGYKTPAEVNLREDPLYSINNAIDERYYGQINSLSIVKDDHLVFENYYNYSGRDELNALGAATFSITVLCLDLLQQDGYISSLDQPIHELLPTYDKIFKLDTIKKQITLRHLLDFNSGLVWREGQYPTDPSSDFVKMKEADDWVEYVLDAPLEAKPGQRFSVHTGTGILLCKIYQNLLGEEPLIEYLDSRVFSKMNIQNYIWTNDGKGLLNGTDGLSLSNLDYAKFGYLLLLDGRWTNQERIISRDWVFEIAFNKDNQSGSFDFQYGWWKFGEPFLNNYFNRINDLVMLTGNEGKTVYILPNEKMIITIMANHSDASEVYNPSLLVLSRIISAIDINSQQ